MTAEIAYTVTFLEMTERLTRPGPPVPAGAPLAILRAEAPPLHYFLYLYRTVGADWAWTDLLSAPETDLTAFVQHPEVRLHTLLRGGAPAGFFQLDFREAGVCDLSYFGLMPEAIGHGAGPWLLREAIDMAWSADIGRMTVNTCTLDHPKALAMYQRAGFAPIRREERTRPAK